MGRRAKPPKGKVKARRASAHKPPKGDGAKVRDLETRLAEALRRETEAREQQTATSEILRVISGALTDVQPVFDTIVRSAARLCNAANAAVFLTDGQMVYHPANYGSASEALATVRALFPRPLDMSTPPGIAILTRSVVQVPDIEDPSAIEAVRQGGRVLGFRSVLTVPMLRESAPVGALGVARREPGQFSDAEVGLLTTFADQAVIAIENVRLFAELQASNRELTTALDTQTATSDILKVISVSPTDVQPVFDAIVRAAVRLCHAVQSNVQLFDGQLMHFGAQHNLAPASMEMIQRLYPMAPNRNQTASRAVLDRAIVHVPDVLADPEYLREMAVTGGFRSVLSVPMIGKGRPIGAITVGRMAPGWFSETEIALFKTFADQAIIAIENVRLFTELQEKNLALTTAHAQVTEALDQQTATAEILRVISRSQTDVQPVFEAIVRNAVTLTGASQGGVYRFDGELIHSVAHAGYTPAQLEHWRSIFPRTVEDGGPLGRAILTRAVCLIRDVETDCGAALSPDSLANMRARGSRSVLSVPMLRDGVVIGAISVAHRDVDGFSDAEVELLQTFADQAVIAIENVRLFTELQASNRDLTTALDKQTATSDILRVISSSQTDVQPVFDAIIRSAVRLLRGYSGALTRLEADRIALAAFTSGDAAPDNALSARFPQPLQAEAPGAPGRA